VFQQREDSVIVTFSQIKGENSCNHPRGISLLLMIRGYWIVFNVLLLRLTPNIEGIFGDPPCVFWHRKLLSIPEVAWFMARVCGRSLAGIADSDFAGDRAVRLL
jgi:hypothetical protein